MKKIIFFFISLVGCVSLAQSDPITPPRTPDRSVGSPLSSRLLVTPPNGYDPDSDSCHTNMSDADEFSVPFAVCPSHYSLDTPCSGHSEDFPHGFGVYRVDEPVVSDVDAASDESDYDKKVWPYTDNDLPKGKSWRGARWAAAKKFPKQKQLIPVREPEVSTPTEYNTAQSAPMVVQGKGLACQQAPMVCPPTKRSHLPFKVAAGVVATAGIIATIVLSIKLRKKLTPEQRRNTKVHRAVAAALGLIASGVCIAF